MSATALSRGGPVIGKIHPHVGAEVSGVDLREPLDEDVFAIVRDAFHQYSVLVFRGQDISDDLSARPGIGTVTMDLPKQLAGGAEEGKDPGAGAHGTRQRQIHGFRARAVGGNGD